MAATILTSAAKVRQLCPFSTADLTLKQYEAQLKYEICLDEAERRAMMVAKAMYYSTRMEAVGLIEDGTARNHHPLQAWKEGNQNVADFMLRKITGINFISCTWNE